MKPKLKKPPDPSQSHLLCSSLLSSHSFTLSLTSPSLNPKSYALIETHFGDDSIEIVSNFVHVRPIHAHNSSTVLRSTTIHCFNLLNRYLIKPRGLGPALNLDGNTIFPLSFYQPHGCWIRPFLRPSQLAFSLSKISPRSTISIHQDFQIRPLNYILHHPQV